MKIMSRPCGTPVSWVRGQRALSPCGDGRGPVAPQQRLSVRTAPAGPRAGLGEQPSQRPVPPVAPPWQGLGQVLGRRVPSAPQVDADLPCADVGSGRELSCPAPEAVGLCPPPRLLPAAVGFPWFLRVGRRRPHLGCSPWWPVTVTAHRTRSSLLLVCSGAPGDAD